MMPWNNVQFKLEQMLEKILIIESPSKEIQEFGDCLLINILICKEIADNKNVEIQKGLWDKIKIDLDEVLSASLVFMKEQNL